MHSFILLCISKSNSHFICFNRFAYWKRASIGLLHSTTDWLAPLGLLNVPTTIALLGIAIFGLISNLNLDNLFLNLALTVLLDIVCSFFSRWRNILNCIITYNSIESVRWSEVKMRKVDEPIMTLCCKMVNS